MSRRRVAVYCRHGLLEPLVDPQTGGWVFDADAIHTLRLLEWLGPRCGMNPEGLRIIPGLRRELEDLRGELLRLRGEGGNYERSRNRSCSASGRFTATV
jgi:hypothetical protein